MLVSVDAGKHSTKAMTIENECKTFYARTKMDESGDCTLNRNGHTYSIEFNGKKYNFGEGAISSDYDSSKTKLLHKIAIYTALSFLANAKEVDLVAGCPLIQYFNEEARAEYSSFIQNGKYQRIVVNGVPKTFTINSITVLPESIGVVIQNADEYLKQVVGVIDIGGLNTNAAIYEYLKPLKPSVFTINEGSNILFAKVKRALNSVLLANYQDYEIPHVMAGNDTKAKAIMSEVLKEQVDRIADECKRYNWNISALPIVFTGGGSVLLEQHLKDKFTNVKMSKHPIWDNCFGYYKLKEMFK